MHSRAKINEYFLSEIGQSLKMSAGDESKNADIALLAILQMFCLRTW